MSGEFVARMEDVLDLYAEPHDEKRPVVCMDELCKELHGQVADPLPPTPGQPAPPAAAGDSGPAADPAPPVQAVPSVETAPQGKPGRPAKEDYEYERKGVANVFVLLCPLLGWRHLEVTAQRGYLQFAALMKALVDVHFPKAERVRVVLDNLNTHVPGALYEAFGAEEARRIAQRLEFHYTPKHGSWLNMAELEFSVLGRQCLNRRIETAAQLTEAIAAWETERNAAKTKINWTFRTVDARKKLRWVYPPKTPA